MCIVISIIEHVHWYPRVTLSSMFIGESSYVSFPRPFLSHIHFAISFLKWDEWYSLRGSRSLSLPSLHSLLMRLHFMFDLSWSLLLFVCSLFRYHPYYCFWFILFVSSHCYFLTVTYSKFDTLRHSYTSQYQFVFLHCLIIAIIFTLGILRSMAHEIFYTCCILYTRVWVWSLGI